MNHTISLQKIAHAIVILGAVLYVSIVAKGIIIPFVFGALFAFLLKSICDKIETVIPKREIAVILSFVVVFLPLVLILALFSMQFMKIFEDFSTIMQQLEQGFKQLFIWVNNKIGFTESSSDDWVTENSSKLLQAPIAFIGQSITSSTVFLSNFLLCLFYTFFLLLYRSSLKKFILIQYKEEKRTQVKVFFKKIQKIVQQYLSGLGLVMIILSIAISLGLYLIGVEYALFWGCLAGFLVIIPYIGTLLGGFLPFIYALATTGDFTQPILIVLLFTFVQTIEGNFITPKVVGSSVKINPLAAIIAMVIGGFIWGIAGLVLALPTIAILKIAMQQTTYLQPLSALLGNNIYGNEEVFEEKFDSERFRFGNFFRRKKRV